MNLKTNPELLPLIEWWEKDGKQTLVCCLVIAVAVCGWYGFKHYRQAHAEAASNSIDSAFTAAEIEDAVSKFAGTPIEGVQKIRLAKKYFDDARFDEALAIYTELEGKAPDGMADVPQVGRAACLEALGKFDEAEKAFSSFVAENGKSFLRLTAELGAARCLAQKGDKKAALTALAALKSKNESDELSKARIEATELAVKRLAPKAVAKK